MKKSKHHLDRRADRIDLPAADDDQLLSTKQLAALLAVSEQWVEVGRSRGYGPRFEKLGPRCVRYRRGDVRRWLAERARQHGAAA